MRASLLFSATAAALVFGLSDCDSKEPDRATYFERNISPVLQTSCARGPTGAGCHVADARGNAFGNLDVTSFRATTYRRDLLLDYGPYGQSAFLIKAVAPYQVQVQTYDGIKTAVTTDIKHTGGPIFDPTATAYQTIRRWIENGATENNTGVVPATFDRLPCSVDIPARYDTSVDPPRADFEYFKTNVAPALSSCAYGNCHGSAANDLYLTCGSTPEQLRHNYHEAVQYLAQTPEQSEIARRPLAPAQGGAYHEGGVIFTSQSDSGYQAIVEWARQHGPFKPEGLTPGFVFFAHKVQPMLVKKGCMMFQCHSSAMFHEYRLRGGSAGSFSLSASERNYEISTLQMAFESDDVSTSRLVRKNLYRPEIFDGAHGILHRGGPLLEDFEGKPATAKLCDDLKLDYDGGDLDKMPAFCVLREWHRREREARKPAGLSAIVYVRRPIGQHGRVQDFDVFAGGADLRRANASTTAAGEVQVQNDTSLSAGCGVSGADIRRPQVSWDGRKVAFAARASASEPFAVYEMNADGTGCAKIAGVNDGPPSENGLLVHNFDPAYAPDGTLVFASTRGALDAGAGGYKGPQRTPADPSKPNANLYVFEGGKVRQLTFLLNMERQPSFMNDGRVIFTAEKREPGFYQLALRRINLDGGDYHPLYAQRGSIGYAEATGVVELADKNFAAVFGPKDMPHGGGKLGVFNRSIGVDFTSPNPKDYPVDPAVLDPNALQSPDPNFFLRSLRITDGTFTTPAPLPSGRVLVSSGTNGAYDVFVLDPLTGAATRLFGEAGSAEVEAVAVYQRVSHGVYRSRADEPNGHTRVYPGRTEAEVTVMDMPVLASLLFQNTPTGRLVENVDSFQIFESVPPPTDMTSFAAGGANVATDEFGQVYVKRRFLGSVPVNGDGSTRFRIPGGIPILLKLPDTDASRERNLPRWQRETLSFAPGEYAHQSFRRDLFNGMCGQCHGAINGRSVEIGAQPDILTQASSVKARDQAPHPADPAPQDRTQTVGPP